MKLREPLPARCCATRIRHCLAVLLLAGWNTAGSRAGVRLRVASPTLLGYTWVDSIPYAIVSGAPPLRFAPEPPTPESPPLAMTAPVVAVSGGSTGPTPETHSPEVATSPGTTAVVAAGGMAEKISPVETSSPPEKRREEVSSVMSILPDELHPQVRPEDFLPFFQVPGAPSRGAQATIVVPLPALSSGTSTPTTPSSATYTQTPK